jgi:hypothetical protein
MAIIKSNGFFNLNLTEKPIIIVGVVKNIEKSITRDIVNLTHAFGMFKEIHWYLVESGSSDKSKEMLTKIHSMDKNFRFESLALSSKPRTEVIAEARNAYLSYLRDKPNIKEFPYIVVADFNLLNNKLTQKAVLSSWDRDDWDVVTANQSGKYYDIWALRHDLWSPNDCWKHHAFLREYVKFPELAITYAIRSRMIKIPKNSNWIRVQSSFGGLGIYKTEILMKGNYYKGTDNYGNITCEHVPFHKELVDKGARLFINPRLINTRYTDHSLKISFLYTIVRIIKYTKIFKQKFWF